MLIKYAPVSLQRDPDWVSCSSWTESPEKVKQKKNV